MRAGIDGLVYRADGTLMTCENHGTLVHDFDLNYTLDGKVWGHGYSIDEEAGEVWIYATEADLKAATVYELFNSADYQLILGAVSKKFGPPFRMLKRLRGDAKLHLTCRQCQEQVPR